MLSGNDVQQEAESVTGSSGLDISHVKTTFGIVRAVSIQSMENVWCRM